MSGCVDCAIHQSDIGVIFEVQVVRWDDVTSAYVALDISAATTTDIKFRKPSGTIVTQNASFSTDGTDGKMRYTSIAGDLDESGAWVLQGYIVIPASFTGHTAKGSFVVEKNL